MRINQYDIVLVNLDPTLGSEINKTRPCLVVSPNEMNGPLKTIIIVPITTSNKIYPTRVEVSTLKVKGWAAIDQIRTIDKNRILQSFGQIELSQAAEIKRVIHETFVL